VWVLKAAVPAAFLSVILVDAVDWSSTITLGSIIVGVIVGLAGLAWIGYGAKYKAAFEGERAMSQTLVDSRDAYKERVAQLDGELRVANTRITEQTIALGEASAAIARLENLPNLSKVLELMGELVVKLDAAGAQRADDAVAAVAAILERNDARLLEHDRAAAERHAELLDAVSRSKPGTDLRVR
jgi:hypothetical protein